MVNKALIIGSIILLAAGCKTSERKISKKVGEGDAAATSESTIQFYVPSPAEIPLTVVASALPVRSFIVRLLTNDESCYASQIYKLYKYTGLAMVKLNVKESCDYSLSVLLGAETQPSTTTIKVGELNYEAYYTTQGNVAIGSGDFSSSVALPKITLQRTVAGSKVGFSKHLITPGSTLNPDNTADIPAAEAEQPISGTMPANPGNTSNTTPNTTPTTPTATDPNIVIFNIPAGTGDGDWNTESTTVVAKVGQTLRFVNNDSVRHRLHTNGAPCPHGPDFGPGKSFDCVLTRSFTKGPLYDHNTEGSVYFRINP